MTIEKAMEILTKRVTDFRPGFDPLERGATLLGLQALERVKLHRTDRRYPFNTPLPTETES